MNVSSEMRDLCDHIVSASAIRAGRLDSLRHETEALRRDAQHMIKGFHDSFGAMARGLWSGLNHENNARAKAVAGLRAGFQEESRATRADLAAARSIWAAMVKG